MRDAALTYHVFLSHSAKDKAAVRAMPKPSLKGGLQVWFDEWVLKSMSENVWNHAGGHARRRN